MKRTVLIAGASGAVGLAAVSHFSERGWRVVALSRRRPPVAHDIEHLAVDLRDQAATRAQLAELPPIDTLVYAALYERPGLVSGWQEPEQMDTNLAMLQNVVEPLRDRGLLRQVTLLQGTKAYGSHLHDIPVPARECQPRDDHENFYWLQEDYLRAVMEDVEGSLTIFRPQLVISSATGVAMNPIPVIAAYAAICRQLGRPCGFPGGPTFVWEAVDSRLLASAFEWAASSEEAAGETFNITNGDVFSWRDLWPALVTLTGAEPGDDDPLELTRFFAQHSETWADVVRKHRLRPTDLGDLLGLAPQAADYYFAHGQETPRIKLLSTVKLRTAGFDVYYDTAETFRYWIRDLQSRGYVPLP